MQYLVYDVFTDTPFGGNQLAIFPQAGSIPEDKLQAIAREFNFSETTFVYAPDNSAHGAKVRIFTPTMEIPFAGHPTIGTAIALRDNGATGDMVLELGIGPIPCSFEGDLASFVTSAPLEIISQPDLELVARALGRPASALKTGNHVPTQCSLGLPFVISELASRDDLRACQPVTDAFRDGAKRYPAGLDFAQFVYVRDGDHIDARMFAPLDNIPEDPATGSACATLAALLAVAEGQSLSLTIIQGEDMGRRSEILAKATLDPLSVTISGRAVRVMEGTLHL